MRTFSLLTFTFMILGCGEEPLKITVSTPTIQCGMCQKNIESGLKKLNGISSSDVNLREKSTMISYYQGKTSVAEIEKKIADLGYQANDIPANPVAYENLPACCKIGGMDKM